MKKTNGTEPPYVGCYGFLHRPSRKGARDKILRRKRRTIYSLAYQGTKEEKGWGEEAVLKNFDLRQMLSRAFAFCKLSAVQRNPCSGGIPSLRSRLAFG